ncbi:hypothetical protein Pcinc_002162 [Petrolisthes cinctipes]|uniref:YqaJ viral recombinase domain-containing protein n=1 Tax=Petrolisthes cinctipes TaxID=88211 RepID=A0AAE1GJW6_PETCI|nr:hypothetical protein Pcinc_002162 [Petrolisthes cinctipes]
MAQELRPSSCRATPLAKSGITLVHDGGRQYLPCMAGTSEVCSHVAATLFAVRKGSDVVWNRTCTSMPCEWNKPGKKKQEQFSEAREINFSKPKPTSEGHQPSTSGLTSKIPSPSAKFRNEFFQRHAASGQKIAILSLIPEHSDEFITSIQRYNLPKPLTDLFNAEYMKLEWGSKQEKIAIQAYKSTIALDHVDFHVHEAGFYVHPNHSFLGASPDAHVTCQCFGDGIIQVKCPYTLKDATFNLMAKSKDLFRECRKKIPA